MNKSIFTGVISTFMSISPFTAGAEVENAIDKTESPYFLIDGGEPGICQLPLLSTSAQVNIAGVIADVTVSQVYKNDGNKPIEAIYVFPGSTRAAVYGLTMTLEGRTIIAVIKERNQARQEYEQAKQDGKSASLLEQQRPNVFQMNVANIMPGDSICVELKYTELMVPLDNVYEFVYPAVVGPRYTNASQQESRPENWIANPYLKQGSGSPFTFNIETNIRTGLPIQEVSCGTHKVTIQYSSPDAAFVTLDNNESGAGNRDYILRYRLAGNQIESGMLLYKGDKENFFCMMVQPPKCVTNDNIPPREYIFVVDVSGSMYGFPLDISKALLKNLISNLRPSDRFNIILFSGFSNIMSEQSLPANDTNIKKAVHLIDKQQGGGGTELLPALDKALNLPRQDDNVSRSIILVTDGYVSVETEAFDLIRSNLNKANLFAFGIGSSVNRFLIEGLAHAGGGEPFIVVNPEKGGTEAEKFRQYIKSPVLTQIETAFEGFNVYDVEPKTIPDVMASRPILVYGKWSGSPDGKVQIRGFTGGNKTFSESFDIKQIKSDNTNSALKYLWARNKIALLGDYNKLAPDDSRIREITELGLHYNLLTAYTSFIAVDNAVRNTTGKSETVKQPLPMPDGVSDYAVGGEQIYPASPVLMSAVPQEKCHKRMSAKPLNRISEDLVKASMDVDEKIGTGVTTAIKGPESVTTTGQTIIYVWDNSVKNAKQEITAIMQYASRNMHITVYIVNTDTDGQNTVEKRIKAITGKNKIPSNVVFVNDPHKSSVTFTTIPTLIKGKPVILFICDAVVKHLECESVSFWNDSEKVSQLMQ